MPTPGANCTVMRNDTPGANCTVMRNDTPGANCTVQKQMPTPGANCIVQSVLRGPATLAYETWIGLPFGKLFASLYGNLARDGDAVVRAAVRWCYSTAGLCLESYPRDLDRGLETLYYTLVGQESPSTQPSHHSSQKQRAASTSTSHDASTSDKDGDQAGKERKGWRSVLGRIFGADVQVGKGDGVVYGRMDG
ncbi:hypothetical protein P171DRAFT_490800 [Karstenula rhodostoma CBS 690.94]|uniref:Uncharacterized protein n=1 Tax=Karstenula rhodostoma CBS 690.94 TaxID=1392251 RepID=A0A9P4P772_9PLEO|nr:hypothetical protein P171DRAFT_490800 [Karstenula rhodostoma CBS 690.94]